MTVALFFASLFAFAYFCTVSVDICLSLSVFVTIICTHILKVTSVPSVCISGQPAAVLLLTVLSSFSFPLPLVADNSIQCLVHVISCDLYF